MKTYHAKKHEVPREWLLVDLEGKTLGRAATAIANFLRGKHKPQFTPSEDVGDFVVGVNADKIRFTGEKFTTKKYFRHSGYPGGFRTLTAQQLFERRPTELLRHAVKGMLPKNTLGRILLSKLKLYVGAEHPHKAQNPKSTEI
ncbi:MAG: 50S ribosomal protein L13 [Pseudomonadota bacterium]